MSEAKKPEVVEAKKPKAVTKKVVQAAEKPVEPEKKEAAKAATTVKKTTPVKKAPAKKAEVKENLYVQFGDWEIGQADVIAKVKEAYKAEGNKAAVKSMDVYVKPEEKMVYYVVNGEITGSIEF
ncbi:MAG TPA: DUF6465 family protein [Lachnospiraceae bacterium]|mgnify:CR=1 FL=1|nr:DUF6465 family protein [Lachnospiraceae bacterium]